MDLPYDQDLSDLHGRIATNATAEELDFLVMCIRGAAADEIERMAAQLGTGSPPEDPDDDHPDREPTREEVLAYAAALGDLFQGKGVTGSAATPDAVIEDLAYQPVRTEAYDLIRSGHQDSALALVLAHERYDGRVACEALSRVAPSLLGHDLAFVPLKPPFEDATRDVEERERVFGRHGDVTAVGHVDRSFGGGPWLHTGQSLVRIGSLRQVWRQVPAGGEEHRAYLSDLLCGLADGDGRLRPGLTVDDVVAALAKDQA